MGAISLREIIAAEIRSAGRANSYNKAVFILGAIKREGYVILSPDEVRGMERDRQAVEFAARWCWRTDPPHANSKLTDAERLSAIKYHPAIKKEGQQHVALAEKESVNTEARENYQRHVKEINRATDAEIDAAIRSLKGGRDGV